MASKKAEQIAESYINGNISWCRAELKKRSKAFFVEVEDILRDCQPGGIATFRRLMLDK